MRLPLHPAHALCACALLACLAAPAQPPPTRPQTPEELAARERRTAEEVAEWNRNPAPSDPRDFSGVWWTRGYDRTFRPVTDVPMSPAESAKLLPLTPLEAASREHHLAMERAGTPIADAPTQCFPHGVPRLIASPYPIQFIYTPGLITMLHEVAHNVRFVHMDGKPPPHDTPRSFLGYSVGHWEGNTLVIVTDHFNDRTQIDEEALSHGLQLKVTERISKFTDRYGGAELRDLITIEDPEHFTRPWTAQRLFAWRGDVRIAEYSCEENNRNAPVNGVTIAK
ncbi:MAG TPA: hypothetical protein VME21_06210 [Steroidobacteraceae bacterium]|nr:hypothetical protein [Steroidobacteraceae bacterium]